MRTAALTFGDALGAPIAGMLVDHHGIAASFAGLGACGLLLAAASSVLMSSQGRRPERRLRVRSR